MEKIKVCSRCIMDSRIVDIQFDEEGICNYCKIQEELEKQHPLNQKGKEKFQEIVNKIKKDGKKKKYDCIIGVSGGADSTYMLYLSKKLGLRPLAVHFDNGWNTEVAVSNIKKAISKLDIDLFTHVVNWEEFKDLQISFLKASTPDVEQPTDHGIKGVWYSSAAREKVKYVFNGHDFRTEGKVPLTWSYGDLCYIKGIYKNFGKLKKLKKLKTFPRLSFPALSYYAFIKGIKQIRPICYMDYRKKEVKKILQKELGWQDYGLKHGESIYTRWIQTYLLPKKFNIDKRIVHYSALIRSGQMTKEEAQEKIKEPPISVEEAKEMTDYVIKKLGLSQKELDKILLEKPKTFMDYPSHYKMIKRFKKPLKFFYKYVTPTTPAFFYVIESKKLGK